MGSKLAPALWALAIVLIVGSIVAAAWWIQRPVVAQPAPAPATEPVTVKLDHDYYLFVRLIEFTPKTPKGKSWDSVDGSAPDAQVYLTWRGNRIFSFPEREDQLINTWDFFRVDVRSLVTSGGQIDVASAINAPIVRTGQAETVTIEVWDEDPAMSDLALKMEISLATLRDGANQITPPPGTGVARLQIDMIDRATPLPTLIELESKRG